MVTNTQTEPTDHHHHDYDNLNIDTSNLLLQIRGAAILDNEQATVSTMSSPLQEIISWVVEELVLSGTEGEKFFFFGPPCVHSAAELESKRI